MECPTTVLSLQRIVDTTAVPAVFVVVVVVVCLFLFFVLQSIHHHSQFFRLIFWLFYLLNRMTISYLVWEGFATIQR